MPRKIPFLFVLVILGCAFFFFFLSNHLALPPPLSKEWAFLPVRFFPLEDRPIIKVRIENRDYSLLVDLGSSHSIDLRKTIIKKIKDKRATILSNYTGIRGKIYPTQGFKLPQVKLANLCVDGLIGFEENLDFLQDAKIFESSPLWDRLRNQIELWSIDGRMGWPLLKEGIALFDFPRKGLILAKDMKTMAKASRYSFENFAQIPFQIEKWGIVVAIETDAGLQKFVLDTGATRSVMRKSLFPNEETKIYKTNQLNIADHPLGSWQFVLFEYTEAMQCDGILGIDFFKTHAVCLDFLNQTAYVTAPSPKGEGF